MSKNEIRIINQKLTIDQRALLINRCVDACFYQDEFHAEMLEPIFAITLMQLLTDREPITNKAIVDDNEVDIIDYNATYEMIENEGIMQLIQDEFSQIDYEYLENLRREVVESLEFKKLKVIAQSSSVSDKIVLEFNDLIYSVKNAIDNFDMSKNQEIFDFISKINQSGVTEDTIIDAIVKNIPKKGDAKFTNISPSKL